MPFATNDHMVRTKFAMLEDNASSLLFPHWDV